LTPFRIRITTIILIYPLSFVKQIFVDKIAFYIMIIYKVIKYILPIIISIPFLISFPQFIYSQVALDVDRATRETDRFIKEQEIIEEKLKTIPEKLPVPELPEPAKKEGERGFFLKKINLAGVESFSLNIFSPLLAKYENKEVTFSKLDTLCKQIEREYLSRNVIAAVFVPPQDIQEGIVNLQVVEAKMGELLIQEHKYFKKSRLDYYWRIPQGRTLHYDRISKSIQMMNKNPDRQVKAALHAGKKAGTTDIILSPETQFPVHLIGSFDKEGVTSTGKARSGFGLRHNNFLGFDDTFLMGYTRGNDFYGNYIYHSLPLSANGTTLLYGFNRSWSKPQKEYADYGMKSIAEGVTLSLHQDIYKKDEYKGEISVGFDADDKTTIMNTGTYNRDRLRVINLGGSFIWRGFGSTTTFIPKFSQGLNAFGASSSGNTLASRGAKSTFSKFNFGIQQRRILPFNLQGNLKFNAQVCSTKLTPQEELALGGIDSVRGYPNNDYLADNGAAVSTELLIPSFFIPKGLRLPFASEGLKETVTWVSFLDYGYGMRRGALPTEKRAINLLGIGAGFRVRVFDQALLRLEWGFPVASNHPVTEGGRSRFHFSVDLQEKLPEELERIRKMLEEEHIRQWAWDLANEELGVTGSPIKAKLERYLRRAEDSYKEGKLRESKEYYEKVAMISKALYQQAESYVKGCLGQQKELKDSLKKAEAYYKEGRFLEAKKIWEKVISQAKPQPLVLEF
jgi:hemolysin activation/secretion protein